jgi:hypothetical protein
MSIEGSNEWGGDATVPAGGMQAAEPALAVPVELTTAELTPVGAAGPAYAGPGPAPRGAPAPGPGAAEARTRGPGRWTRSPNVVDRATLLGVMVLPAEGAAVVLTGVVAEVWRALARPTPGDQIVERVSAPPAEVAEALRRLRAMGAVREMR